MCRPPYVRRRPKRRRPERNLPLGPSGEVFDARSLPEQWRSSPREPRGPPGLTTATTTETAPQTHHGEREYTKAARNVTGFQERGNRSAPFGTLPGNGGMGADAVSPLRVCPRDARADNGSVAQCIPSCLQRRAETNWRHAPRANRVDNPHDAERKHERAKKAVPLQITTAEAPASGGRVASPGSGVRACELSRRRTRSKQGGIRGAGWVVRMMVLAVV